MSVKRCDDVVSVNATQFLIFLDWYEDLLFVTTLVTNLRFFSVTSLCEHVLACSIGTPALAVEGQTSGSRTLILSRVI